MELGLSIGLVQFSDQNLSVTNSFSIERERERERSIKSREEKLIARRIICLSIYTKKQRKERKSISAYVKERSKENLWLFSRGKSKMKLVVAATRSILHAENWALLNTFFFLEELSVL